MTQYYLTFTDNKGNTFAADGSPLYAISDFDFSTLQTLNIGSQSEGAGAGKIAFEPLSFTLSSSYLTNQLDQWLASGTGLAQINLIGYDNDANGQPVQVVHDVFKDVGVKSDVIDVTSGLHAITVEYGGLVESATPLGATGVQATPVPGGWDDTRNVGDTSPTDGIGNLPPVTLPTLDPAYAVTAPIATPGHMYARFLDNNGNVVGGGWIELTDASFGSTQTLNIGANVGGVGAGKVTFDPLTLTFAPGTLEPTLLKMEASGTSLMQLDVAVYSGAGGLTQDYRFGLAAIQTSDKTAAGAGDVAYTFEYGQEQIATYSSPISGPSVSGWDRVLNVADTSFTTGATPTTEAAIQPQLAKIATGENDATQYYLTFTDAQGDTFDGDGNPLYEIDNFNLPTLQTLNIGSQSAGAGAGKITFNPFTFELGSSQLTQKLDQVLASGTPFAEINLIGYEKVNGEQVQVLQDAFKLAAVKSDDIDAVDGVHSLAVEYGGLVESATPLNVDGTQGKPVVAGWNAIKNISDSSLSTGIGNLPAVTLPTLDPTTAVAASDGTPGKIYAHFIDYNNNVVGGGWIELSDASFGLTQTLNIGSQSNGAGAGKVTFDPLNLTFEPGTLEPALLEMEASGTAIKQLDVVVYSGGPQKLEEDYRFGQAAIKTSDKSADGDGSIDYTFEFGQEQIANYSTNSASPSTPTVSGWDRVQNVSDLTFDPIAAPASQSAIRAQAATISGAALTGPPGALADLQTGESQATQYYLTFTDAQGNTFDGDGNPLYQIDNFDFSSLQTLNIGSQSTGSGAGKVAFNPLTFDLSASKLTQKLDQMLASGAAFSEINLIGYDTAKGKPVQVIQDAFKLAALKSDAIDVADGVHSLTVDYGGLVESATPLNVDGTQDPPVAAGWNDVLNVSDSSLTTGIESYPAVTLPTLDPTTAVAAPTTTPGHIYARFLDYSNNVLGGGWIELDSASFGTTQTLNIGSQSAGSGAGKVTFDPLNLTFAPGTTEPRLLQMEASGTAIMQLDVAVYDGATGALTQDYRFGLAAIKTSEKTATGAGDVAYTFEYGQEQIAAYSGGSSPSTVSGWDRVQNVSDTSFTTGATPTTEAAVQPELARTVTGEGVTNLPCFTGGVRLKTDRGEATVESLKVGDRLLTLSGAIKPIVWIGRRRYVCGGHPNPEQIWPVVVAAGAFGEGMPERDLVVSPGHALYVEGRLVQAIRLVNGATIRQAPVAEVDYWHVELPAHDVVYAEGMLTESYLDTGNRNNFEGAGMTTHPDFGPKNWDQTCVPYLDDEALPALRQILLARTEHFGFAFDDEPDLYALADGRSIPPVRLRDNRYAFVFPEGVEQALLVSRTWRPCEATLDNLDPRTLGVCIGRLDVDGSTLDLADERLTEGWSRYEPDDRQRWTTGRAKLPPGLRVALLDVCGVGRYLRRPRPFALEA